MLKPNKRQQPSRHCKRAAVVGVASHDKENTAVQVSKVKCELCDWTGLDLKSHVGIKHKTELKCPTCGKLRGSSRKSNFNAHVKACAAKKARATKLKCANKDDLKSNRQPRVQLEEKVRVNPLFQVDAVTEHGSPEQHHSEQDGSTTPKKVVENCVLRNKFVPNEHTSEPEPPYERRQALLLPKVNDDRSWRELDNIICDRLKVVWPKLEKKELDDLVFKFEEAVHCIISDVSGVHEPKANDHPRRSRPDRPNKLEKRLVEKRRLLRKKHKAIKRAGGFKSDHQAKQAGREYSYVLSQIKRIRKIRKLKADQRAQHFEQQKFRKDPWNYAKEQFNPPSAGEPDFGVEEATEYFAKLYTHKGRSGVFEALPEWVRPALPTFEFDLKEPTFRDVQEAVKGKRNKNAPGINAITFLVYKKCPGLLKYLTKIIQRVWKSRKIPRSWQCALIVLIAKSSNLKLPSEFRPIALLNAEGRIFFTLMQWRLSDFMVKNGYIDSKIQKGFMKDVAGCVEHSETMYQMLMDARRSKQDICVSWIDLANAYGSVEHSLFQFSMEWYHVPDHFCEIIFNYYEGLMAAVMVKGVMTRWFRFMIGVFQGCTASTILFNVAFNTCFEHLNVLREECGYQFSKAPVKLLTTGYADDLGMATRATHSGSASANNQRVTDSLNVWLSWSRTMKAKPKKCIAMALVGGKPVEPELKIESDGKSSSMARISDEIYDGKARDPWFKFLGRYLIEELTEKKAKALLLEIVTEGGKLIDSRPLKGAQKVWIWDSFLMAKISWLLLIHDIPPTFVENELQPVQTRWFRLWLGFPRMGCNVSIFYRSREHHGLQLKEMCSWHKQTRLIRRHIVGSSQDPQVRAIHNSTAQTQRDNKTNQWKDCLELESLQRVVKFEKMRGPLRSGGAGLGWGSVLRKAQSTAADERQAILRVFKEIEEEERIIHVTTNLTHFCEWVKWEAAVQLDRRWHSMLYSESDSQLRFRLLATEDVLPTPSILHMWGAGQDKMCPLGCKAAGSLRHILCGCSLSERPQSRVTWRHDSVLYQIYKATLAVSNRFKEAKARQKQGKGVAVKEPIKFKSEGSSTRFVVDRVQSGGALLELATDWKFQFDVESPTCSQSKDTMFPVEILETSKYRPDGVIWSLSHKVVIWIELTCPWEENMSIRHFEKQGKYNQLKIDCEAKGWRVHPFEVEVGCRGYTAESFQYALRRLGFSRAEIRELKFNVEKTAQHCSHAIFVHRYQKDWGEKPLLDVTRWHPSPSPEYDINNTKATTTTKQKTKNKKQKQQTV